jgi:hypothetical protein
MKPRRMRYETAADEIAIRIDATTPKTIAGAIALLELTDTNDSQVLTNVIAGLRKITAKGGAA